MLMCKKINNFLLDFLFVFELFGHCMRDHDKDTQVVFVFVAFFQFNF